MERKDRATAARPNVHALLCEMIRTIHLLKSGHGIGIIPVTHTIP